MTTTRPTIAWHDLPPDPVCDCRMPADTHDDGECPPAADCRYCKGGKLLLLPILNHATWEDELHWFDCPCTKGARP